MPEPQPPLLVPTVCMNMMKIDFGAESGPPSVVFKHLITMAIGITNRCLHTVTCITRHLGTVVLLGELFPVLRMKNGFLVPCKDRSFGNLSL